MEQDFKCVNCNFISRNKGNGNDPKILEMKIFLTRKWLCVKIRVDWFQDQFIK